MVITISREFGAGGRSVAKALSEKLNVPWYYRDFTKITSVNSGYSEEEINAEGETLSDFNNFLEAFLSNSMAYVSSRDEIFKAQKNTILELAQKENCIIVGRCAGDILKDANVNCLRVFLYSDLDSKTSRAMEILGCDDKNARKYVEKIDHMRDNYYKHYVGHDMGSNVGYDVMLNTGFLGIKNCVDILADIIQKTDMSII